MTTETGIVEQPLTRKNVVSLQEYVLQGSIMDGACDVLLHRLRGLCDNADSPVETFHDIEQVFTLRDQNGTPFSLRARNALDNPQMPWQLRYVGQPEVGDKNRFTMCRSVVEVGTSSNLVTWLNELGFRLDFEYVVKGHMFQKGRMKVLVQKVFRVCQSGNPESLEPVSQSYLIELSVLAPPSQENLGEEMKAFAEQLKPLVELEKVDHTRLQIM
ncbi:mediator of RNA polymerase II transcription subunit 18-like isoform X1 [Varroa jacobsoni]|uniref:Mediator of RNA polymerase II transcription subunit 18 n=2 Tax=Varroa destructor TaxID=109461 RepID=A0A7M7KKD7_VARDE|nr:mediator of RNA polymerase II transcription subunit 18-like isoform X1 [Varroa destructor]XP_022662267.1 mediator of RNA polymerase II transcription subunit 18-like isoform X1 [Varroa destructor]XP_022662268.1 mediator of RNA polymerase II transcription subunit 18-like isoform X1 [Varroa destructor]XP_022703800.1 mediator of RNA polymerase II transcription subunit 18-like isoform X1 [Varroa jacobsoni]XP_022703801.1 mediator of RNA polymerase II transcription subunit 18-like isoform X1 [Varro